MAFMIEIANMYIEAFIIGLLYGFSLCTSSCLPYVASYIAAVGADFRKGIFITLTYNVGRVTSYAVVGILASFLSSIFRVMLSESLIFNFQNYASYAFGAITIAIGINILLKSKSTPNCVMDVKNALNKHVGKIDTYAFLLGFGRGFIICPPLAMLILYAITFGSPIDGSLIPIIFGVGTAISPILPLGGVTGWLLNKAPLFRRKLSIIGSIVLILLGIASLLNTILV
ncbi:MAG: sulfite exporter TauE/SafE family protein [Candidatus Bathyarchaeia archaeon]|nr:sulfite exporter TauE/SafE family protein [Candidatus Bathyarchaeota archaeon]